MVIIHISGDTHYLKNNLPRKHNYSLSYKTEYNFKNLYTVRYQLNLKGIRL